MCYNVQYCDFSIYIHSKATLFSNLILTVEEGQNSLHEKLGARKFWSGSILNIQKWSQLLQMPLCQVFFDNSWSVLDPSGK